MIPFFVVDRPMSLNIVKTFFAKNPNLEFGLMSHVLVSPQFRKLFAEFPCQHATCWLNRDRRRCRRVDLCSSAVPVAQNVVRMVDCGIFHEEKRPNYETLFDLYEEMNADYGIMMDFFGDPKRTIASARRAAKIYRKRKRTFKLVLVAQGESPEDYVKCTEKLVEIGVGKIAIGGLLRRKEKSARYASAGTMDRMDEILSAVRKRFPKRWLFVLGCYHSKRHELFERHNVFGSD